MKVTHPIANNIVARLKAAAGKPLAVSDLLDLGDRAAVDQSLSRLVRHGTIFRAGRGLYVWPRISTLFNDQMTTSVDSLAQAWARKNGLKIIPSGAYAANLLGLSTQVPAKIVYYTNGRTQTIKLGTSSVRFLNRGPKTMNVTGRIAPHVFQAIRWIGKRGMTSEATEHLQSILKLKDKCDLIRNLNLAPGWMQTVLKQIAGKSNS